MLEEVVDGRDLLKRITTGDETWVTLKQMFIHANESFLKKEGKEKHSK